MVENVTKTRYHGKHMRKDKKRVLWRIAQVLLSSFVAVAIVGAFFYFTQGRDIPVLDPKGVIADQQYVLILITVVLGAFVIVPVFVLLFAIAWRYRSTNKKAKYDPGLDGNIGLEIMWWGIPIIIIIMLAIVTFITSHSLDPFRKLESDKQPVTVQVISLEWNWLFIYPDYNTATLNYMNIPEDTPINLEITADSPMNTFWIPALAGQIYAMSGMQSKLHIMANEPGSYQGSTTNISGPGYADLRFTVYSKTEADFATWATQASQSADMLTASDYETVSDFKEHKPETTYMLMAPTLFDDVIMKYMHSTEATKTDETETTEPVDHSQHHAEGGAH